MVDKVTAAVVQQAPIFLDTDATLDLAQDLLAQATAAGAQVVVFPETWLPGYPVWIDSAPEAALWGQEGARALYQVLWENGVALGSDRFARILKLAADHDVHLVMGMHERRGGTLCNSMVLAGAHGGMASAPQARAHLHRASGVGARRWQHVARVGHAVRAAGRPGLLGALDAAGPRGDA